MTFHTEAFSDYCNGMSIKKIGKKHKKSEKTVKSWSSRERWKDKRKEKEVQIEQEAFKQRAEAQKTIIKHLCSGIITQSQLYEDVILEAKKAWDKTSKTNPNTIARIALLSETLKLCSLLGKEATAAFRKLFPEVDKEAIERLIQEMLECKKH